MTASIRLRTLASMLVVCLASGCVSVDVAISSTSVTYNSPTTSTLVAATTVDLRTHVMAQSSPRELSRDIALGAGPTVNDLAHNLDIAPERLGAVLRRNRRHLLPLLLVEPVSDERAKRFAARVRWFADVDGI